MRSACEGRSGPPAHRRVSGEPALTGGPSDAFLYHAGRDIGRQAIGPQVDGQVVGNNSGVSRAPCSLGLTGRGRMFPDSRRRGHLKTLPHRTLGGTGPVAGQPLTRLRGPLRNPKEEGCGHHGGSHVTADAQALGEG